MPKAKELNERDTKLAQWLNEAYAKEAELEAALTSHIALTQKASYKKRLQQHLKETREHKRAVARRIKQLGAGQTGRRCRASPPPSARPSARRRPPSRAGRRRPRAGHRAGRDPRAQRPARSCARSRSRSPSTCAIETFATAVGDKETAQLAKRIRREEQRMAKYLTAELPRLVKDVVKAEMPRDQRATASRARRRTTTRSRSTTPRATSARGRRVPARRAHGPQARGPRTAHAPTARRPRRAPAAPLAPRTTA